jgi:hypothetical protein
MDECQVQAGVEFHRHLKESDDFVILSRNKSLSKQDWVISREIQIIDNQAIQIILFCVAFT